MAHVCRVCGKEWPADLAYCPEDQALLSSLLSYLTPTADRFEGGQAEADDLGPGLVLGEYKIVGKLGAGGMGAVYAAEHPVIGKKAAVKVIKRRLCANDAAVDRFVREARAVNQISHPNIVDVFSFGTLPDGRCFFVMEWLQGETLADRLGRGRPPLAEALAILDQLADALEAAHEQGIIHRDLKPDNVFLESVRGRQLAKLLDFGLAKLGGGENAPLEKTRTGLIMGTPAYISPEQARGRAVDGKTDVYALGCMAFEMLVGRLPFEADNAMEMIAGHLATPPPPASSLWPDVPPVLDRLVSRMMAKDPEQRPTLAQVRAGLREAGRDPAEVVPAPPAVIAPPKAPARPAARQTSSLDDLKRTRMRPGVARLRRSLVMLAAFVVMLVVMGGGLLALLAHDRLSGEPAAPEAKATSTPDAPPAAAGVGGPIPRASDNSAAAPAAAAAAAAAAAPAPAPAPAPAAAPAFASGPRPHPVRVAAAPSPPVVQPPPPPPAAVKPHPPASKPLTDDPDYVLNPFKDYVINPFRPKE